MKNKIIDYYNESWLPRFEKNHNPSSFAMHMGYFEDNDISNDLAKLKMNDFLISQIQLDEKKDTTIVDAGCGVGGTSIYLAENYSNLKIIGVNIHKEQIVLAKKKLNKTSIKSPVEFIVEDYANTSISSSSVDVLFAMESMCHAIDKTSFLNEAYRLLKAGGICLIFDYFITKESVDLLNEDEKELMSNFSDGWAVKEYAFRTIDEDMKKIGFSQVDSFSISNKVMQGINNSYFKAEEIIKTNHDDTIFFRHLKANIALKKLMDLNIVDYRVIKAIK